MKGAGQAKPGVVTTKSWYAALCLSHGATLHGQRQGGQWRLYGRVHAPLPHPTLLDQLRTGVRKPASETANTMKMEAMARPWR